MKNAERHNLAFLIPRLKIAQDHPSIEDEVTPWLQKMHALVVGPGLGRSFSLMSPAKIMVHKAIELGVPLVIDADGIYLISCDPDLVRGERNEGRLIRPGRSDFGQNESGVTTVKICGI